MLRLSRIVRRPIIEGTGEWKAGQGRVQALKNLSLESVPRPGVPTRSAVDEQLANEVRDDDHESVRNPVTGEWGGFAVGREPVKVSQATGETCWQVKGRCSDF
jgi:hypothetical protein